MISTVRQAANNRRSLASMRAKLLVMAADWDEVDQYFLSRFEELAHALEEVEKNLDQYVKEGGVA